MKFSIKRSAFIQGINMVSRAISSKTTIPILTGLKLSASNEGLVLTGSNADVSIETVIDRNDADNELIIEEEGSIVLPARFFSGIVKKLPSDKMTLSVANGFQTEITSGTSSFTINGLDAADYPHLPEIENDNEISLSGDVFKEIINQTVIAVSNQESRPILTGVHFVLKDGTLFAVATDSHRLSQRKVALPDNQGEYDVIIPGSSLSELSKMISDDTENVKMKITENQVLFTIGNTYFYSRLLEGTYPDTSRLIPKDSETNVQFDAYELLGAIERASLLSHESRNNVVKLTIKANVKQVTISGNSPDVGNVEEEVESKEVVGNDLEISFNPDYMKDALRAFGHSMINVAFTSSLRPFTLVPSEDAENFIELITPVRTF
ncbi:DNA polymerase III subunit beta [Apilactobacillus kunkeei]|uniref:Beta sliding clamp n=1 Tax=Apilactobacillus kunkeei DSM 12361 = ATCC 700308 TaxID=1423768 RepID=A0A0R1FMH3_9LACO|nr:DNA polymerase III subunit beta [Apilactobacillus kunkeei]KOY70578.1 DNA polymerase III subunit beta [Apilactobacillus kunkeei]KOY75043.1 DNA polymerase III subunit beta [Apilactobacillus kunkeei DSM 12361 = ATCC 700308]KPN84043.1 DNA polymerase III subunit beta [Apilactobacillus kunkeei]KRK22976.1 DNA polymerase III subunit beta [Apilactobacillus kunkeei DSM 12361 = ATCC 700308]MCK8625675.1 DNA polymerase III subunit beta [Apilactobacillus kunkeei]